MRAHEFIPEAKDEELDEFLPLIGAAGGALARGAAAGAGALGRGAMAAGRAIGRGAAAAGRGLAQGAKAVGNIAGQAAVGIANGIASGDDSGAEKQDSNQIKAGGRVSIPKLGAVDIIAVTPTGVTLNTRTQLGFNITVDPRSLQR